MQQVTPYPYIKLVTLDGIFRYPDMLENDEELHEWSRTWKNIKPEEKLAHTQEFFRMLFSDGGSDYYYSFCNNDVAEADSDWHCITCGTCRGWREWHCKYCNQCMHLILSECVNCMTFVLGTYGATLPCERCGEKSETSDLD